MSLRKLEITGQVGIIPCAQVSKTHNPWIILIMGPTGAGKSKFIEALAGPGQSLGISKDQLAGFTQDVVCYEMKNAAVRCRDGSTLIVYLIDTPGFSDSKISEMEIINKVKGWLRDQRIHRMDNIQYLTPITDTRVPGSKRRTIKMLQSLLRDNDAVNVTVITTMWDRVSNNKAKERAEAHFAQLQDDVWKDLVDRGTKVVRFQNDHTSAIDIVTNTIEGGLGWSGIRDDPLSKFDLSASLLYQELLDRINSSRQEIHSLRIDHIQLISYPDPLLESVVEPRLQEARHILAKFLGELVLFGDPPPGFDGIPEQIVYQSLLDSINEVKEDRQVLDMALSQQDMDSHAEREPILRARLLEAEENLARHSEKLAEYKMDPKWYEKASQVILDAVPRRPPPARASFGSQVKKGIQSVKDKLSLRLRRGPHH